MECPQCNATMDAEEIKFGWNSYTCTDCDYVTEGLAYEDYMDIADGVNWGEETYDRLYYDIYNAPDYPRDVVYTPLPKTPKTL